MRKRLWLLLPLLFFFFNLFAPAWAEAGRTVEIDLTARQFEYEPSVITVRQGDKVRINLAAEDVTHGWYLQGYDISMEDQPRDKETNHVEFVADKAGKFTFRCTVACGPFHPFMVGTLIVEPRTILPGSVGLMVLAGLGSILVIWRRKDEPGSTASGADNNGSDKRVVSLTEKWPWLKSILRQRWLQFAFFLVNLFFFAVILVAGFVGTSVGSNNFALIFVWILWWAALILILIPFGGRLWCGICPLPAPGEWLDRRAFIRKGRERARTLVGDSQL